MNSQQPNKPKRRLSSSKLALIFDVSAALAYGLSELLAEFRILTSLVPFLVLWIVVAIVVGVVLGIIGLADSTRTKADTVCSIVSITLPALIILILILLFSTGVLVIRFM